MFAEPGHCICMHPNMQLPSHTSYPTPLAALNVPFSLGSAPSRPRNVFLGCLIGTHLLPHAMTPDLFHNRLRLPWRFPFPLAFPPFRLRFDLALQHLAWPAAALCVTFLWVAHAAAADVAGRARAGLPRARPPLGQRSQLGPGPRVAAAAPPQQAAASRRAVAAASRGNAGCLTQGSAGRPGQPAPALPAHHFLQELLQQLAFKRPPSERAPAGGAGAGRLRASESKAARQLPMGLLPSFQGAGAGAAGSTGAAAAAPPPAAVAGAPSAPEVGAAAAPAYAAAPAPPPRDGAAGNQVLGAVPTAAAEINEYTMANTLLGIQMAAGVEPADCNAFRRAFVCHGMTPEQRLFYYESIISAWEDLGDAAEVRSWVAAALKAASG